MTIDSLKTLYVKELKELHNAERQLVRAMPGLTRGAHSSELKAALKHHLGETKQHVKRLEQLLGALGESTNGVRNKGMAALIKQAKDLLKEGGDAAALDAGLITAAQKVEHYEIAGYGSARTFANMLRYDDAAEVLQKTLNEEGAADETLSELSQATLSGEAQPQRVEGIAMEGDTEPGGVDLEAYQEALRMEAPVEPGTEPPQPGGTDARWVSGSPAEPGARTQE